MTKYKLEDFKTWLEADETRKGNLSWNSILQSQMKDDVSLEKIIKKEDIAGITHFASSSSWEPYREIVLKWKLEIDNLQNSNENKITELNQEIAFLKQENERLRNRQLNDNEKAIITIFPKAMAGSSTSLDFRLTAVREFLEQLKKNNLSIQATPNLSVQGISLPECLAANLTEIVRIGDFYFHKESEWEERREELEEQIKELKEQNQQLSSLISPNQPYNFQSLHQELKRLKIQDLTIQIPLKKQELEQNINTLKNNLNNSAKYLLDKLLKKQNKLLQNKETNSNKLEEIKQTLTEDLENQEQLQNLLNKQKELFNLEKHLENLQSEQVTQIIHNPPRNN